MILTKKALYLAISCMVWMVLLLSAAPIDQAQAVPTSYYVNGDNTGSDNNLGTLASPYKTIQKCATKMIAGDTCYIRGGVYRETITPANSGNSISPIKFAAYNGESVTISGADLITGWTLHSGSIYKATMNWNMTNNVLFVDNLWAGEAKWPNNVVNSDILNPASWAIVDSATANPATEYTITDSALSTFASGYWNGGTVVSVAGVSYGALSSPISSFSSNTLHFAPWAGGSSFYQPAVGDLYYITNSLNALDTANEWYKDSATNTLYLMAPTGDSPNNHIVEAKKRDFTFDLSNKSYVELIEIQMRAASVKMTGAANVKIVGMKLQGATQGLEGSNNVIRDSEISKTIGSGIELSGQNNSIINNYIHDVSYSGSNSNAGITLSGKNQFISHNTLSRSASHLITGRLSASVIQYNNIYDAANLTEDVGILYLSNSDYENTEVHHNWIHDNNSRSNLNAMGLYMDNYVSNLIAYRNVVWNALDDGIRINAPYSFQLIYNNSVYNKSNLVTQIGNGSSTQYMNNIVYDGVVAPPGVALSNNFTFGDPKYVNPAINDFQLQATSPAKDRGRVIAGVTNGYVGSAPDIGAYEYGGVNWTAGHNFTTKPNPVFTLNDFDYENKISNAGFEDQFLSWSITGTPQNVKNSSWDYKSAAMTNMHANATGLKTGDKIEKTVIGLIPNTTYIISDWGKIDGKFIQAETCDTCYQAGTPHWVALPNDHRSEQYIGPLQDGDYLSFNNISFNNLYDRIELGINNTKAGGSVEVRLDSATGTLLGTLPLANYYSAWKFQEIPFLSTVTGTHHLYLVFKGAGLGDLAILDSIKLKHSTMNDSMKIGVKNYNGSNNIFTSITSPGLWAEGVLLFTTGATNTSATIYVDKPTGNYVGYIDNLGIVQSYLPIGATFYDSFENGFGNWSTQVGLPSASTTQLYSGNSSYVLDQDVDYIQRTFASTNKVAVVRFYDDASDISMQSIAFVDDSVTSIGLGVETGTSTSQYVYRIGGTWTSALVNRSTGWHEFTFDYRSGTDVKLYIDGILVVTSTASTSFNRIFLGDAWGGSSGTVYFDDISVQDALPFTISEGFESGFGNWNTQVGPPSASTTQKHSGNSSYVLDQDIDYIQRTFTSSNKVAVLWFYDDAADLTMLSVAHVDDSVTPIAMGVNTGTSTTKYAYRIGSTWTSSVVNRSTGWHELTFDYRSGVDVKMYIDGVYVAYSTSVTSFNRMFLGDAWGDGKSGTVYFDDIVVRDELTFKLPLFWDGFENGFANWLPQNGAPLTSTLQKYNMNYSYALDQDQDSILHGMSSNTNKVAVVWFYDDAVDTSMTAVAFVDDSVTLTALGVVTATSSANYIYRVGGAWIASTIPRTTGWHKLTFDYRSGTDVKLYIDGTLVATSTASTFFKRIYLGDAWGGSTGNVYFDDVSVQDNL